VAPARLQESGTSGSTYRLVIGMTRNKEEERAQSNSAACPTFALPQREPPAAARKSELPLSRFPLRGKAGAGGFPPRRRDDVRQQKTLAHIMLRLPPQGGFQSASLKPPLRIPPMGATGAVVMADSTFGIGREKLRMAATSTLTFTTFS